VLKDGSSAWERVKSLGKQFFKFGLVGATNTLIAIVVYNLLLYAGVHYIIAYLLAFIVSVVNAYVWNNRFVFKAKASGRQRTFLKVVLAYGSTGLLGMGLLYLMVRHAGVSKQLAQILILFVTIPVNFFLNKLWAFKEKI
jgi:putative flippase GtrA